MRITLSSKQADGTPNWVEVREPDDFLAEELMAIHRAVRESPRTRAGSPRIRPARWRDDQGQQRSSARPSPACRSPAPIPQPRSTSRHRTEVIGRTMKGEGLVGAGMEGPRPLIDKLKGAEEDEEPKEPPSSD